MTARSQTGLPETEAELVAWDFWVPAGGASVSPASAFRLRKSGEFETLHDIAHYDDAWRFWDAVGKDTSRTAVDRMLRNLPIKVYRTPIEGRPIVPGSYVTERRDYAIKHGRNNIHEAEPWLYEETVRPSELVTLGDPHEFLYVPESASEALSRLRAATSAKRPSRRRR